MLTQSESDDGARLILAINLPPPTQNSTKQIIEPFFRVINPIPNGILIPTMLQLKTYSEVLGSNSFCIYVPITVCLLHAKQSKHPIL